MKNKQLPSLIIFLGMCLLAFVSTHHISSKTNGSGEGLGKDVDNAFIRATDALKDVSEGINDAVYAPPR